MDKQLISKRFSKAIATYPQEANVQRQIADKMIHLLTKHISFPCSKVIEFGCGTGIYSRMLLQALRPEELFLNDLCPEMKYCCEDILRKEQVSFLPGDAEIVPYWKHIDNFLFRVAMVRISRKLFQKMQCFAQ
jgi:malonyl-CoA O-methyltransferase